jgi:HSP20 family molecular chaperone IbpA
MRSDSLMAPSWFFPRRWMSMMPNVDFDEDLFSNKMKSLNLFPEQKDDQVIRMKDDNSKFELSLDTHGYRPDEIKVNVAGGCLSVDAKHEEKEEGKFVSRQFSRKYTLPEGCEAGKVNSNLSSDGVLVISAPKRQAVKQEGNSSITVEVKKN